MGKKIFEGIKVLDFTNNVAGPATAAMLADHGAEVIKIERPVVGGDERAFSPRIAGVSVQSFWLSRGKKSVEIALDDPEGIDIIKKIIPDADIIIESFRPGIMKKFGLDYEAILPLNPQVVYCSVSAFGQTGPYFKKPGYDIIAQALSGIMDLTGDPHGAPQKIGPAIGDYTGALNAFGAIAAAMYHKLATGEGQYIDIALLDGLVSYNSSIEPQSLATRIITRNGNHMATICPYGVYNGKNQQAIIIAAPNEKLWKLLCAAIGKEEEGQQPDIVTQDKRVANIPRVVEFIESWLVTFDNIQDAADLLEKAGIPCCKVKTTQDLLTDEHLLARGLIVEMPAPPAVAAAGTPTFKARGPWAKFSKTPVEFNVGASDLGQYNQEIFTRYGLSPDEANTLAEKWRAAASAR